MVKISYTLIVLATIFASSMFTSALFAQSEFKFHLGEMYAGVISPAFHSTNSNAGTAMLQTLEVSIPSESYRVRIGVARDNFINDKNILFPPMGVYIEYSKMLGGVRKASAYWRHNSGFVSLFNIRTPAPTKNDMGLASYTGIYTGLSGTFPIYYIKLEIKADITLGGTRVYKKEGTELGFGYITQLNFKIPIGEE